VLVLGATSGIAKAIALELGLKGHDLYLAGRDADELSRIQADVRLRTKANVWTGEFEAGRIDLHGLYFEEARVTCGTIEGVVLAFGYLGDQARAERDRDEACRIIEANYTGAVSILLEAAKYLESEGRGWIVALGSVAGDRGRQSNYIYGSAKAGLAVFLQGLRARLYKAGVHVMTVKAGPVDTGMTFGMEKLPLLTSPQAVAKSTVKALAKRADVVYLPWPWRPIMAVLRAVPERLFKRTSL
jgi:short-subunit dehydrogenase